MEVNQEVQQPIVQEVQTPAASALQVLKKACGKQDYRSFRDLPIGQYLVEKFSRVETTHGERIRVDIEGLYLLLPERFAHSLTENIIEELNKSSYLMIYSGKDVSHNNRLILDFVENALSYSEILSAEAHFG